MVPYSAGTSTYRDHHTHSIHQQSKNSFLPNEHKLFLPIHHQSNDSTMHIDLNSVPLEDEDEEHPGRVPPGVHEGRPCVHEGPHPRGVPEGCPGTISEGPPRPPDAARYQDHHGESSGQLNTNPDAAVLERGQYQHVPVDVLHSTNTSTHQGNTCPYLFQTCNHTCPSVDAVPDEGEQAADNPNLQTEDFDLNMPIDEDIDVYAEEVHIVLEDDNQDESTDDAGSEHVDIGNTTSQGTSTVTRRRRYLTNKERQGIYEALLERSYRSKKTGNITQKRNSTGIVAAKFNVTKRVVQNIWTKVKKCHEDGVEVDVKSKRAKNCGRKRVDVDLSGIHEIPYEQRASIRSTAEALHINKSKLHRLFKEGLIRRHSSSLKPYLKDENKKVRLRFCVSMLDPQTVDSQPTFIDMQNIVHIDEKWFNATTRNKKMYLGKEENEPLRSAQNRNSIKKVMFLVAFARRRKNGGHCYFDGKIGMWAFVNKEPAQRNSRNRPRGTLITKPVNVNRNISRSFMITKVLPAIARLWPREDAGKTIWIQQDNAKTHIQPDDPVFAAAVAQTGMDIRIMNQPPNSPDMNVLDLGFFASLQAKTYVKVAKTEDDIVRNVEKEFNDYDGELVNKVFLTLQGCFIEIMKDGGGNGYKVPHIGKDHLERIGMLPTSLTCDIDIYRSAMQLLLSE